MKPILITLSFLMSVTILSAQVTFEKTITTTGESIANAVQQTNDGGYIIAGTSDYAYSASGDILLIKTNEQGDTAWTKMFGGFAAEQGNAVIQTFDGGYMVAGSTNSFGAGGMDAYLVKTDAYGNLEWSKTIGSGSNDAAYGIVQTADSGYVFSGNEQTSITNGFAHLVKTDKNGNVLWSTTFGNKLRKNFIFSMQQTSDGGFIMGGYANNYISTNDEFSIIKADEYGNLKWYKTYGDMYYDHNFSICEAADGGYAIAGINFELAGYNYDVNLIKVDTSGNLEWTQKYGGAGHEDVYTVTATNDGGFVFAGSSASFSGYQNGFVTKTDAIGDVIWSKTMDGTGYDIFFDIKETSDGGYVLVGVKDEVDGVSGNLYFVKTDADGNTPCNISVVPDTITPPTIINTLFITGTSTPLVYSQIPDENAGANISTLCCVTPEGLFTNNITASKARLKWSVNPDAFMYEVWYKKTGAANWKIKFVPGIKNKLYLKNLQASKNYVWRIRTVCDTIGIDEVSDFSVDQYFTTLTLREGEFVQEEFMILYPNPVQDYLNLAYTIPENATFASVQIYNMQGQIVLSFALPVGIDNSERIDVQQLPSGVYHLQLITDDWSESQQFIKQ